MRQFGTTSLLVYWVHIELVYGRASGLLKGNLNVAQTLVAALAVILLMLAISVAKTHRGKLEALLQEIGWSFSPRMDRISGD